MSLYPTFDHFNPPLGADGTPMEYLQALRDEAVDAPIGWSESYGGYWIINGYDEINEIMDNPAVFSNKAVTFPRYESGDAELMLATQDNPKHKKYRSLVAGPFSPGNAQDLDAQLRASANTLIDAFIEDGRADLASGLAEEVPARMTAILLGLPAEDGDLYRKWTWAMTKLFAEDPEAAAAQIAEMGSYVDSIIEERRARPAEDLMSTVIKSEVDGEKLSDLDLHGFFSVLLLGGLDNTSRFLGTVLWRLGWDKELRQKLIDRPEIIPLAVDELLRFYTPAAIGRLVLEDTEFHGHSFKADQTVWLNLAAGNRDPRAFEDPDSIIPDRQPNKHLGLGRGMHRCLGAHLIRVEARATIEEFLKRIPEYELDPNGTFEWCTGQVQGFLTVPVVFPPGKSAALA